MENRERLKVLLCIWSKIIACHDTKKRRGLISALITIRSRLCFGSVSTAASAVCLCAEPSLTGVGGSYSAAFQNAKTDRPISADRPFRAKLSTVKPRAFVASFFPGRVAVFIGARFARHVGVIVQRAGQWQEAVTIRRDTAPVLRSRAAGRYGRTRPSPQFTQHTNTQTDTRARTATIEPRRRDSQWPARWAVTRQVTEPASVHRARSAPV